ncbi:MAG: Flp pilus assembly protein CpaB [Hyphomicrobiaceae bacterium]
MRRARLIVFAIAILAAGMAALLANGFLGGRTKTKVLEKEINTIDVLVARKAIGLGERFKAADFGWQPWPKSAAAESGYITKSAQPNAEKDYVGAIARTSFLPNEPLNQAKVVKADDGGVLAAILPAGMRAISTKITEESAVAGFILPADRVDVIVTRKVRGRDGRQEQTVSDTLFKNVKVLAIGQEIETKEGKMVASGKTATLELSPAQAETLALAQAMGDVSLTLRSLSENKPGSPEGDASAFKPDNTNAVRMLRYGEWSRTYGVK